MSHLTNSLTRDWRVWPLAAVAVFLLNASVTFENVWPTPKIRWGDSLSIELAVVILILVAAGGRASRLTRRALPALWVTLIAGHYLDVTGHGLYGRDFNLYWDAQHLGNVGAMLARAAPWWLIVLTLLIAVLAITASYVAARLTFAIVGEAVQRRAARLLLGVPSATAIVLFAAQMLASFPAPPIFADPVTPAYLRQARYVLATLGPRVAGPSLPASPALDADLGGLDGADVYLVFVESYGAVTFDTPSMAAALAGGRADLERAVSETGRQMVSAYTDSPTFGASSWLAHLTLLSGVEVRDQYAYTSLMSSGRETLVTSFARRGYRTVALMPGMRQAWPEGAFYGFDEIYGFDSLAYDGPRFGWWTIPDQYALAKLDALESSRHPRALRFVVFPTSTTHAPFGPVAPYQTDWSRLLTDEAYDEERVEKALSNPPDLTNLRPSYVHAMAYEYATLAGYLREHAGDDLVMIAIGDHQPPAAVSGADASWLVPVHVIASQDELLTDLEAHGFRPGLEPGRPPIGGMHTLVPILLQAFDDPGGVGLDVQYASPGGHPGTAGIATAPATELP